MGGKGGTDRKRKSKGGDEQMMAGVRGTDTEKRESEKAC